MIRIRRHARRSVPTLNTASLPDLIFTVLFFFMIVTHMRKSPPITPPTLPEGTELSLPTHKGGIVYIYINKNGQVQLGDKICRPTDVVRYIENERRHMASDDQEAMTVVIKADRQAPMGVITEVKQQLRRAEAYNVSYSATPVKGAAQTNKTY